MNSFEEELNNIKEHIDDRLFRTILSDIDDKFISKQQVREVFDGLLIGLQEEATSKWNSETERKVWSMAYRDVVSKLKELGLEDE